MLSHSLRAWPGWTALDRQLADTLVREVGTESTEVWLSVALLTWVTRRGDVCVDMTKWAGRSLAEAMARDAEADAPIDPTWRFPELTQWQQLLVQSGLTGRDGEAYPMVLKQQRLYLARFRQHELELAARIHERLSEVPQPVAPELLRELVEKWFGDVGAAARRGATIAATRRWCMITGGPGTGKTSTVVRILGMLQDIEPERPLRVLLLAPTGKAAARLSESIRLARERLSALSSRIFELPMKASTIHAALAACRRLPDGSRMPLMADVVVLDEASMVDLAMMRRLMDAARHVNRFVLLGDPHQLASVEAGAVLAELRIAAQLDEGGAQSAGQGAFDASRRDGSGAQSAGQGAFDASRLETSSDSRIGAHCVHLVESHRFRSDGGIGLLAACINSGDVEQTLRLLDAADAEVRFLELPQYELDQIEELVANGSLGLATADTAQQALSELDRFRVLCAHRRGRYGVETWNERVAARVRKQATRLRLQQPAEPILITENAREVGLFNGDLGVVWRTAGHVRACFVNAEGITEYGLSRLPKHEPAYVMSVHKSQGSEVDEVVVLLPDVGSALLTRELLYTAVTRARRRCTLVGTRAAIAKAVANCVERHSGLSETLRAISPSPPHERGGSASKAAPMQQLTLDLFGSGKDQAR